MTSERATFLAVQSAVCVPSPKAICTIQPDRFLAAYIMRRCSTQQHTEHDQPRYEDSGVEEQQ